MGTPFAESLFVFAAEEARKVGARFAGYSNGDIAFDSSVLDVLKVRAINSGGQFTVTLTKYIGSLNNLFSFIDNAHAAKNV